MDKLMLQLRTEMSPSFGSDRYAHVRLIPYMRTADGDRWASSLGDLDGIQISCQIDNHDSYNDSYAWTVEYRDVFSVDVAKAETMFKRLRSIYQKLDKMDDIEGRAQSFGSYVNRVMRVLKIETMTKKDTDGYESKWGLRDAVFLVNNAVYELKQKCKAPV